MRSFRGPLVAAALLFLPGAARAQGSLGMQGLGYPTGQLSTRALGTGGGQGEFDPASPLNPAALVDWGRSGFSVQYDPEFRRTTAGGARQNATVARFPVVSAGVPIHARAILGFSASTFLDRSFSTEYQTATRVGDETVTATERVESRGSIADIRVGVGVQATRWLRVGIAGHALSGENRLVSGRLFADTSRFGSVSDTSSLDYSGVAGSAGVHLTVARGIMLAGSYRRGGTLEIQRADTTLRRADSPDRLGVGLRFDRVTGASFGASYARTNWSAMRGLGGESFDVRDTRDVMLGLEALGPRLGETVIVLRLGGRDRTLPFGIGGATVAERAYSGGLGVPLARGRVAGDVAFQYATRRAEDAGGALAGARERAMTVSVGFTVRP